MWSRSPGLPHGSPKVAGSTGKTNCGILHCTFNSEEGLPGSGLVRGPRQIGSDLMMLCWMIRGGRDFMSLLKLQKADLFAHGRFWIWTYSDTQLLNLNGNTMMMIFLF